MASQASEAEAELERFRREWQEEVARNRRLEATTSTVEDSQNRQRRKDANTAPPGTGVSAARRKDVSDYSEDVEPRAYHDLPDKDEELRLGQEGQHNNRESAFWEPSSALEHYERAVEKETHGQLGDSLKHYRRAFRLDDGVHEAYKKKHFPPSSFIKSKPANPNPSNASTTQPNPAYHSLHAREVAMPSSIKQMVEDFSSLRIEAVPPPTEASPQPPCPLAHVPDEILTNILTNLAASDVGSFTRCAQVCKRLAYLVLTEESVWKYVAMHHEIGFPAMHYDYACDFDGFSISAKDSIARFLGSSDDEGSLENQGVPPTPAELSIAFSAQTEQLLHTTYAHSWRQMFRARPRIRFNGCYISTVNYTRPGAQSTNTLMWGTAVHVVTYYRYLRFFRDGTAISLLSTSEPADVVHHLRKENLHGRHHAGSTLPSSVMRDALRGRWRLSGPASSATVPSDGQEQQEEEGDLHVETEGVVPKYTYHLLLALAHAGKQTRNNKLAWKGFWSHNKLTDDWAEFGLKNDRAFYWSRVKSYGL